MQAFGGETTQSILDVFEAGVAMIDASGAVVGTNPSWRNFPGEDQVGVGSCGVGDSLLQHLRTRNTRIADGVEGVLNGLLPRYSITLTYPAAGQDLRYAFIVKPIAGEQGGAIVIHADVSSEHMARDMLQEQQRWFEALVRQAKDLIAIIGPDGTISYQSPSIKETLGYELTGFIGQNAFDFVHPDDVPDVRNALEDVSGSTFAQATLEFRVRHLDGSWRYLESTLTNLPESPIISGIVVNSRDVTDRKRAFAQVAALAESFSTLFHGTAEAMVIHDDKVFSYVNEAFASMVGLSVEALKGREILDFIAPESVEKVKQCLRERIDHPYEITGLRADGSPYPMELLGRTIRYDDMWQRLIAIRDVTERRKVQDELALNEARFRALVQDASDIVVVFDKNGGLTYSNPALVRLLGHDTSDYAHDLRLDLAHPDDRVVLLRAWSSVTETPEGRLPVAYRMMSKDGTWVWLEGTMTNLLADPAVEGVVFNLRDVSNQKALEEELRQFALHDPLTGLPNRTLIIDRMDQAIRMAKQADTTETIGAFYMDLDYFKPVNDSLGHAAGNAILCEVADRLSSCLTARQTLARIGGDEFVAFLPNLRSEDEARDLARRMHTTVSRPYLWQGEQIAVGISIGIGIGQAGYMEPETLLREADDALYEAKRSGRGRTVVFANGMNDSALRRYTLNRDIHGATERNEFQLYYQPIVSLDSGKVSLVEALIRWNHPVFGQVPPDEFIPFAEGSGNIVAIGKWVIREVCRQLNAWGEDSPAIAVNLSASQFTNPDVVRDIETLFAEAKLDPRRLKIEITEHTLIEDFKTTTTTLNHLKQLGVAVAIDDFGTGFSSLQYLRDLPVAAIKLDRSFVHNLGSGEGAVAIVDGIISLAHALGLVVTAEGIETCEQLRCLVDLGCDHGQGYFLGRPAAARETPPILALDLHHLMERHQAASD